MLMDYYPLKRLYPPFRELKKDPGSMALLIIDMQYLDAARGYGFFKQIESKEVLEIADDYFNRIEEVLIPHIISLQEAFRRKGIEVVFSVIESLTSNGRDRSKEHKRLGVLAKKGSKEAQVLEPIKPIHDEIVIKKTASGVFSSTNLEYVLKNVGIETLFVTGVLTDECVETTVREAADRSFEVVVIEDACATFTKEAHKRSLLALDKTYAQLMTTEEVLHLITSIEIEHKE